MTTSNIPRLEELDQMQRRIDELMAQAVRERDEELQAEADRLEGQRARLQREFDAAEANAQLAARLRAQVHTDRNAGIDAEMVPLREEQAQLDGIIGRQRVVVEPEASQADQLPPPDAEVAVTPAPVDVPPPPPNQVVVQQNVVRDERPPSRANPRNWSMLQWVLAIAGALFFRFVLAEIWHPQVLGELTGNWRDFWSLVWFTAMTLVGFFLGGAIGAFIHQRQARNAEQAGGA